MDWGGEKVRLLNVYTPVDPDLRKKFLSEVLPKHLTKTTIAVGDWNCVPDVTTDVQSNNPLGYSNIGGQQLGDEMSKIGLSDFRREQLGTDYEPTRIQNGTATRLDRA